MTETQQEESPGGAGRMVQQRKKKKLGGVTERQLLELCVILQARAGQTQRVLTRDTDVLRRQQSKEDRIKRRCSTTRAEKQALGETNIVSKERKHKGMQ